MVGELFFCAVGAEDDGVVKLGAKGGFVSVDIFTAKGGLFVFFGRGQSFFGA